MRVQNTKFICTLGPASKDIKILEKMTYAGMDVARLNFSHGDYKTHAMLIKNIRKISKELNVPLAIMQDLQGPKIRIGSVKESGIQVKKGEKIILTCGETRKGKIPVQYKKLYKDVKRFIYNGKLTRKYIRYLKARKKMNEVWINMANKLTKSKPKKVDGLK